MNLATGAIRLVAEDLARGLAGLQIDRGPPLHRTVDAIEGTFEFNHLRQRFGSRMPQALLLHIPLPVEVAILALDRFAALACLRAITRVTDKLFSFCVVNVQIGSAEDQML